MDKFWDVLKWLILSTVGSVLAVLLYRIMCYVRRDLTDWIDTIAHKFLDAKERAQQIKLNSVKVIPPDENGRSGILYDGKAFRNADTGEAFTILRTNYLDPMRVQLDSIQKTLLAARGVDMGREVVPEIMGMQGQVNAFPEYITLKQAMKQFSIRPGIHNLFLGVRQDEEGRVLPVCTDMEQAVHMLISGASGWGKSTLMESLAKQLALSGDADLCYVDYGVNTFGMLEDQAIYPIADTPESAIAMFRVLIEEGNRRKELLREYPRAKNIDQYNEETGEDLRPIVCFVDESASLFQSQDTKQYITELTQMARKFGMWLVLGGTDFKATTIPSSCTGNCGARIGFHLMPGLSRSLLNCTDAFELGQRGRALALIPGKKLVEIQCPIVENWDDLPDEREKLELPVVAGLEERIKELYKDGYRTISDMCRQLGLATGGADFYKVRDTMRGLGFLDGP